MKKLILLCSVLFILQSCEQKDLTTYESDKGYSFSYSQEEWNLEESGDFVLLYATNQPDPEFRPNINIYVQDLSSQPLTLEEYHKKTLENLELALGKSTVESEENITVSDYPAKELVFTIPQSPDGSITDLKVKQVYTIKDNKAYLVSYTAKTENFEVNLDPGNTIFESFRL